MPKRITPLTDIQVNKARAKDKSYKLTDGGGLYLLISPTGGKLWRMDYRYAEKRKTLAFGPYPDVSLANARKRRDDARKLLSDDVDPSAEKKLLREKEVERRANTFENLALEWHERQIDHLATRTRDQVMRRLNRDVLPAIGDTPLSDISSRDILEKVLRPMEDRGAIDLAHRIRGTLSQILRYGVARGLCDRDFTSDLRGALKPIPRKHHAALDQGGTTDSAKVGELLRAIDGFEGSTIVKYALQLHPFVATRPGELRHAEWVEVDFDTATWSIPAGKMKMKKPHVVPLSSQALDIIKKLNKISGKGKYLFPSIRSTAKPISDNTMNAGLRRLGYTKDEIVSHGWRAIFRTLADEVLQERIDIIEAQLAHQVSDTLGRAYNRTSFIKERRELMNRWGQYLEKLKLTKTVVRLAR